MNNLLTATSLSLVAGVILATPVQAGIDIPENQAQEQAIPINIVPGQTSAIHFQNEHRISYLILSDRSKIVYSLNAPTESGEARSIFLRNIEPLDFPGEIKSSNPNLFVITIDKEGIQREYEFQIVNSPEYDSKINIIPVEPEIDDVNAILTELGLAGPEDIRRGLKSKLHKGELDPDNEIVVYTSEIIALTLNSEKNLLSLAEEFEIPLSVLSEFGRIGLIEKTKRRIEKANRVNSFTTATTPKKTTASLNSTRQALIDRFTVYTNLGQAYLEDLEFALSVMRQKKTITPQKEHFLTKVMVQIKNGEKNLSSETITELKKIGRLGLAYKTRLKVTGSIY